MNHVAFDNLCNKMVSFGFSQNENVATGFSQNENVCYEFSHRKVMGFGITKITKQTRN